MRIANWSGGVFRQARKACLLKRRYFMSDSLISATVKDRRYRRE